ncbi:hypothetical protein [Burkholderia cenocepacia]|uniref:hypothetical protein n=1 Tax=Burkholderia cenocepacia TaxID=95486 RepID=UPI001589280B|nr:hypothetical protein [Burkholderia cenocepacia]
MKNGRYEESDAVKWYSNDQLHREDGPAFISPNGTNMWYSHGAKHRLDGPAIEYADGFKAWYVDGNLHREDGPAVEWPNGNQEWWINDESLTKSEFNHWLMKKELNEKLHTLPPKKKDRKKKI